MTLLHLLSYVAALAAFMFVTLSIASGLLWISELIEEHSKIAKIVGKKSIYIIILIHLLLAFTDALPLQKIAFSTFCHVIYLQNFSDTWPVISLTSQSFIASCILVVVDHFMWFFHFAHITHEARQAARKAYRGGPIAKVPTFGDMATFFGICVWFAPLFLFLSLSANDNTLPTSGSLDASPSPFATSFPPSAQRSRSSLFRSIFNFGSGMRRSQSRGAEGLLAPRSPTLPPLSPSVAHPLSPRTPTRSGSYGEVDDSTSTGYLPEISLSRPPPRRVSPTGSGSDGSLLSHPLSRRRASDI